MRTIILTALLLATSPVYTAEPSTDGIKYLKPGYIPQTLRRSQIDSKRTSVIKGYLYRPETGTTRYIELRSYRYGKQTYYQDTTRLYQSDSQAKKSKPLE
jgi:hypothetical protein